MKTALVPGSFDPVTLGHLSLIKRASALFDKVIVCVMQNDEKTYLFDLDERYALVRAAVSGMERVTADKWDGELWKYAESKGVCAIVKGIRNGKDAEYEIAQAKYNGEKLKKVYTLLLPAEEELSSLSSTRVRALAAEKGDLSGLVTPTTLCALKNKQVEDKK